VKKDQEIDASFNISHLSKRTPKIGARTERTWYLMWKTADPCLLKVVHSECWCRSFLSLRYKSLRNTFNVNFVSKVTSRKKSDWSVFVVVIRFVISCSNVMQCWYGGRVSTEEAIGPLFRSFVALRAPELNSSHRGKIFVWRSRDFLRWIHQNFTETSLIPLTNQTLRSFTCL